MNGPFPSLSYDWAVAAELVWRDQQKTFADGLDHWVKGEKQGIYEKVSYTPPNNKGKLIPKDDKTKPPAQWMFDSIAKQTDVLAEAIKQASFVTARSFSIAYMAEKMKGSTKYADWVNTLKKDWGGSEAFIEVEAGGTAAGLADHRNKFGSSFIEALKMATGQSSRYQGGVREYFLEGQFFS